MMHIGQVAIPAAVRGFRSEALLFNVGVESGRVVSIEPSVDGAPAQGTLLPALVDLHVHLDKSYTVAETGPANGDLFKAIELIQAHRAGWTAENLRQRMERGLSEAWHNGTRALRTHLDWMSPERPPAIDVFLELQSAWRGRLELQWVSLTALDMFRDAAWAEQLARQVKEGGGILGCFIYRNPDLQAPLQRVFDLAERFDLALDFHVDEGLDADATGLRAIAQATLAARARGWAGRVTCGHACSLSVQPSEEASATLVLCAQAGVSLVALPTTNLYLQGSWQGTPLERGITRLIEARQAGVNVALASDNVADPFFPYGCYDPLEAWALGVQMAHLAPAGHWLDTVTTAPAKTMGLAWDGRIAVGAPADFLLLQATDTSAHALDLMTPAGRRRRVCRQGQWI
ncbi:MAG: amidohydrolase family protein [Serpentinimonas sp.]|jgi:cytosine deaminase|nr:amidohydrolase family protein [Serpentinimonas sp.]